MTPRCPSVMVVCNLVKEQRQCQQKGLEICGRGREEPPHSVTERKPNRRGEMTENEREGEETRERKGWAVARPSQVLAVEEQGTVQSLEQCKKQKMAARACIS